MTRNPRADRDWLDKIRRRERFADFAHTLARIEWDYFTTHTFINPIPKPYTRVAMFWRWASDISKVCGVPLKNLLIALRCEQGEIGARPHLHALVGAVPGCNKMSLRSRMFRQWKIIANNGDADFRLYDRSLGGADYICKCLGANAYEVNKFSLAEATTLSDSVITLIGMLDANSGRRYDELKRKERQALNVTGHKTSLRFDGQGLPVTGKIRNITASPGAGMDG
jgi:hypothetical protein